ncbi:hypothetical protein, partial [Microbacterium sp. 71-23]
MGKKRDREVTAAKVMREEEWAYDRRNERLSFRAMRELSALPVAQGGLGYALSEITLKSRSDAYFARLRDHLAAGVVERRQRQQDELDALGRMARAALGKAAESGTIDREAFRLLLDVQKREAALYGLDAPTQAQVEIVSKDAITAELEE